MEPRASHRIFFERNWMGGWRERPLRVDSASLHAARSRHLMLGGQDDYYIVLGRSNAQFSDSFEAQSSLP